jgi:hypothetical protein
MCKDVDFDDVESVMQTLDEVDDWEESPEKFKGI